MKVPFLLEKSSRTFFERLRELNVLTTVIRDLPASREIFVLSPVTSFSPFTNSS